VDSAKLQIVHGQVHQSCTTATSSADCARIRRPAADEAEAERVSSHSRDIPRRGIEGDAASRNRRKRCPAGGASNAKGAA